MLESCQNYASCCPAAGSDQASESRGVVLLKNEAASKQVVMQQMCASPWTHVACHAHPAVRLRHFLPIHLCPIDALATRPALFLARPLHEDVGVEVDGLEMARESILTVDEVRELELVRGCVVVLSACCTGQGHTSKSEGIVGLARAFLFAGASTVVCTLWEVRDESQKLLMHRFYSLVRKGMDLCSSLYEAQLSVRSISEADLEILDDAASLDKWCNQVQASRGIRRDMSRDCPSSNPGDGSAVGVAGSGDRCPLAHYRHWAGVILIGSTHPPWMPTPSNLQQ